MRAVRMNGVGARDVLSVAADVARPVPKAGEVLVKVAATAINRADIMQRKGNYPPPPGASEILGLEMAGTVVDASAAPASTFPVGARVMALLTGGGYAEYVAVPAAQCMPVPEHMPLVDAAALPETFLTAFQAMHNHAGWTPATCAAAQAESGRPRRLLMHAGGSGVGVAACQIAKRFGCEAVTTSSDGKVKDCAGYATHAVSRTPNADGVVFKDKVEGAIGADGVDLVIDPVFGGSYLKENAQVLAKDGVIVVLSFLGGPKVQEFDAVPLFRKRGTLKFSTLRSQSEPYKEALVKAFSEHVLPGFSRGADGAEPTLRPVVAKVLSLDDIQEAHRSVEENEMVGKCVVVLDADAAGAKL